MKKLVVLFSLLLGLIMLGSCLADNSYTAGEVAQIVDEALTKGELANLLYLGEFATPVDDALITADGLAYGYVEQDTELPLATKGNIWALIADFTTTEDIKAYMQSTFVPQLAEEYLAKIFTSNGDKYLFQDGQLLQCRTLPNPPLSLIRWQHQPLEILTNQPNELTVRLSGEFILTGTETQLSLTLSRQNGQWLLDTSFSPLEQPANDFYYTKEELQSIVNETITRANKANLLYVADNFRIIPDSRRIIFRNVPTYDSGYTYDIHYGLIDQNNQQDADYAALAKEFTTTAAIKQLYEETFVQERAKLYLDNLFAVDYPRYIDQPEGLAYNLEVSAMPIMLLDWQPEDYIVWLNTEALIVLIMRVDDPCHITSDYYPLRLQLVDGKWLCDETYEAPILFCDWHIGK